MKRRGVRLGLLWLTAAMGCATAQPFSPSQTERARFEETVRRAQDAAGDGPHQITTMLAEAKSEFEYAQHLPKYPERARALAAKAQQDAEAALRLAQTTARPLPPPVVPAPAIAPPVAPEVNVPASPPPIRVVTATDSVTPVE